MIACGACYYGYQFLVRVAPNVITDELARTFAMPATSLGIFSSCFYLAYASVLLPLGILMDRWGPRWLFGLGSILCAGGCILFSYTSNFHIACMARFMMGMGASCGFLGTLKLGTLWLPPEDLGRVIACTVAGGTLGAMAGARPSST